MFIAALCVAAFSITSFATAAGGKLTCFADSPATCTLNSATSATINATAGGDAGVFLTNGKSTQGVPLANAGFSFTYFCANTTDITSCSGGGIPRWSIPINIGGDPKDTINKLYAFLDGNGCMNGGETPTGGAITVSTALAQCPVNFHNVDYNNWAAFATANPTYTIAGALPFVISDGATPRAQIVSSVVATKS